MNQYGWVRNMSFATAARSVFLCCCVLCLVGFFTARADAEYVDFCDYYPLAVGNLWRAEWGTLLAIEGEVTGRLTVNGVVVWEEIGRASCRERVCYVV